MKQIIAMGGGGFTTQETSQEKHYGLERYLLKQCNNKPSPNICFLGQASAEDKGYTLLFYRTFLELKAEPSHVSLFGRVENHWKQQLLDQDIIYVGGGNTKSMLAIWREWGLDKVLSEAYDKGIILSGLSAGALCWFEECITDSVWPLGALKGLGFLKGSCCPHYDGEPERRPAYQSKVRAHEVMPGIALEDGVAAHYVDGKLKTIFSELPGKNAYQVTSTGEMILEAETSSILKVF